MRRRIAWALFAAALVPGLVGCDDTKDGSPTTSGSSGSTAQAALFDPCTGISDDVLRASGVDPATKETGIAGVHQAGWEICNWKGPRYALAVFSTGRTVDEFERKPGNIEFQDVTIAGREGRQFRVEGASKGLMCDVVFPAKQGVLQLKISNRASLDDSEDPCGVLRRVGASVVPVLPR